MSNLSNLSRREFIYRGLASIAALSAGELLLRADARTTDQIADLDVGVADFIDALSQQPAVDYQKLHPTATTLLGNTYRQNAPFRLNVSPGDPGQPLILHGRVWGADTRKPLPGAVLEVWQANMHGSYDNDRGHTPPKGSFKNRAQIHTGGTGEYAFESIHPGPYRNPPGWRASHIHFKVHQAGYASCITQLFFEGDPLNKTDQFIKPSLIVNYKKQNIKGRTYLVGNFDFVLAKA